MTQLQIIRKNDRIALYYAEKHGYLDRLCFELNIKRNQRITRYTHSKERTLELARNYKGTCFHKDHLKEYYHAVDMKYLKELNEVLGKPFINKEHSKERTLKIAENYMGINFAKDHPKEYRHAANYKNKNYLKELNEVLDKILNRIKQSKERTLKIAENYMGINFAKDHPREYDHATDNGYLEEMKKLLKNKRILIDHSKERTLKIYMDYTGTNFKKDYNKEYNHAMQNKYLKELKKLKVIKKTLLK